MKKIAILVTAFMLSAPVFAQIIPGAGYINSTLSSGSSSDTQNGLYAGASMEMGVPSVKGLTFVPGAYLSLITATGTTSGDFIIISGSTKSTFTEVSINVPAYFKYSIDLNGGARVFAYAGPTAQLGLFSKTNTDSQSSGLFSGKSSSVYDHYTSNTGYNRFNFYIGGGIGFGINKFSVNVGYDYGLMNVLRGVDRVANRANLHIGISYAM